MTQLTQLMQQLALAAESGSLRELRQLRLSEMHLSREQSTPIALGRLLTMRHEKMPSDLVPSMRRRRHGMISSRRARRASSRDASSWRPSSSAHLRVLDELHLTACGLDGHACRLMCVRCEASRA